MATKAELETEVARLRRELEEARRARPAPARPEGERVAPEDEPAPPRAAGREAKAPPREAGPGNGAPQAGAAQEDGAPQAGAAQEDGAPESGVQADPAELAAELAQELARELEGAAARKPLLTALAAFVIGLALGRALSR